MSGTERQQPSEPGGGPFVGGLILVGLSVTVIVVVLVTMAGYLLRPSPEADAMESRIAEMLEAGGEPVFDEPAAGEGTVDVPLGTELAVVNADAWGLAPPDEMILRTRDAEVRLELAFAAAGPSHLLFRTEPDVTQAVWYLS
jgi:hypothetical protein